MRPRSGTFRCAAPGMSFLEIVFAVSLLGILAGTLMGAANYMLARQRYEQRTMACLELSNRLILQFLDDRDSLPDPAEPLSYGGDQYRWTLEETPLAFTPARIPAVPEGQVAPRFDKFRVFKVRVWLAVGSVATGEVTGGIPHAEISRMYDVGNIFRSPDALERMLGSEEGQRRLRENNSSGLPMGLRPKTKPSDKNSKIPGTAK